VKKYLIGMAVVVRRVKMSKLWDKAVDYYLTHDDIETLLLVCCWAFLGWMMYHAFNGIMERIYC